MRLARVVAGLLSSLPLVAHAAGPLLIAGGALAEGSPVYAAFAKALHGRGPVLVIPAAGDAPATSAAYFAGQLAAAGVAQKRIRTFPLAVANDPSTPDVDESSWSGNAARKELLADLGDVAGVWFTGGDQMRIVRTLRDAAGRDTPLLALVRERHAAGAVVGGSSAGAAIMSDAMIGGGDGFTALLEPLATVYAETEAEDTGRLWLSRGLGFFEGGIVDQHFDRRARLGRLVRALGETRELRGYGIDENTALLVEPDQAAARVLGAGGVTVLDASDATFDFSGGTLAGGLQLALFPSGVRFSLQTLQPLEGAGDPLSGHESYTHRVVDGGGMAFANARLEEMLGYDLLDNGSVRVLNRDSADATGRGLRFTFTETGASRGWCCGNTGFDRYTAAGVRFDVTRTGAP